MSKTKFAFSLSSVFLDESVICHTLQVLILGHFPWSRGGSFTQTHKLRNEVNVGSKRVAHSTELPKAMAALKFMFKNILGLRGIQLNPLSHPNRLLAFAPLYCYTTNFLSPVISASNARGAPLRQTKGTLLQNPTPVGCLWEVQRQRGRPQPSLILVPPQQVFRGTY